MKEFTSEERKSYISAYIQEHKFASIGVLKENLQVSEMTVRRDLKKLEEENALVRVFGGARIIPVAMREDSVEERVKFHAEEKDRIARYAASLIKEGDTILMDSSSTIYAMVPYLNVRVTVLTNNINICIKLKDNEKADVILLGGHLRKSALSAVGMETVNMLENYYVDKAFLSSKAIDSNYQIFDATSDEAAVKRAMMRSSQKTFFLMDHYKLSDRAFCKVCDLKEADRLIVDRSDEDYVKEYMESCKRDTGKIYCV